MKVDPHGNRELYLKWKKRSEAGLPGLSNRCVKTIGRCLSDMEQGRNIARGTKKGARSFIHINTTKNRLVFLAKKFRERCSVGCLTEVSEDQAHDLFGAMRSGEILKADGQPYRSTYDYVKVFRSFWHWHMRFQKRQGLVVEDICQELDDSKPKPPWVYLTIDQVRRLCNRAKFEYRVLLLFLFDSGIRSPTELVNLRRSDFSQDCSKVTVREEVSKTFGRRINLLLSPSILVEYFESRDFLGDDYVFPIDPKTVNKYLRRLCTRVFGQGRSQAGELYSRLSMYDFRHSSACYWLPRYPSESALKYRFGWKKSEMIHYYTELLGMKDTVTKEDLNVGEEKTALESELQTAKTENSQLRDEIKILNQQMNEVRGSLLRMKKSLSEFHRVPDQAVPLPPKGALVSLDP